MRREGGGRKSRWESRMLISEMEQFPVKKKGQGVAQGMDGENGGISKVIGREKNKGL